MAQLIGDQLRRAILTSGMSRYELCRRVELDQASMSKFLKGERGLSLDTIDAIGKVLGLTIVVAPRRKAKERVKHG